MKIHFVIEGAIKRKNMMASVENVKLKVLDNGKVFEIWDELSFIPPIVNNDTYYSDELNGVWCRYSKEVREVNPDPILGELTPFEHNIWMDLKTYRPNSNKKEHDRNAGYYKMILPYVRESQLDKILYDNKDKSRDNS